MQFARSRCRQGLQPFQLEERPWEKKRRARKRCRGTSHDTELRNSYGTVSFRHLSLGVSFVFSPPGLSLLSQVIVVCYNRLSGHIWRRQEKSRSNKKLLLVFAPGQKQLFQVLFLCSPSKKFLFKFLFRISKLQPSLRAPSSILKVQWSFISCTSKQASVEEG